MKDGGQGYAVTELGRQAVKEKRLPTARAAHPHEEEPTIDPFNSYDRGEIARRGVFAPANPVVTWVLVSRKSAVLCLWRLGCIATRLVR